MNWSNCSLYKICEDERKEIMTYCDVQCSSKPLLKAKGTDWPVVSDKEVKEEFKKYDFDVVASDNIIEQIGSVIAITRKAQAKHTGELADAVIVWMCYFAQRQERGELVDFILDRRWFPEHWHYAEGVDFRTFGSGDLWLKLKERGVSGLLEYLKAFRR